MHLAPTLAQRIRADLYGGPPGLAVFGIAAITVTTAIMLYLGFYHSPPSDAVMWAAVMDAHPDAGMECHATLVERIQHLSGMLRDTPYAGGNPSMYGPDSLLDDLATRMVLESDWRPPECGGAVP